MTAYLIADIKVTDGKWVPDYAASVHELVSTSMAASIFPAAAM
ncbi:uncharacterized protein (DUF1330 family) [Bradyrhizobium sp. GM2.4]